ncbi:helix-turn-helix domain-containing protein [Luteibacter pinisoli]|nr:AraC family transcriptional regulator [Luteibacter pinisoli]
MGYDIAHAANQRLVTSSNTLVAHASRGDENACNPNFKTEKASCSPTIPPSASPPQVGKRLEHRASVALRAYIDINLAEKLPLTALGSLVGLSQGEFSRRFKATFGQTPHQYILDLRLNQALGLLSRTSMKVGDIAAECGLTDHAHLCKWFRRRLHMTPQQWRMLSSQCTDAEVMLRLRRYGLFDVHWQLETLHS